MLSHWWIGIKTKAIVGPMWKVIGFTSARWPISLGLLGPDFIRHFAIRAARSIQMRGAQLLTRS